MQKLAIVLGLGFFAAMGSLLAQEGAKPAAPGGAAAVTMPAPANLPLWAYGYAQPGSTPPPAAPPVQDDGSPKTLEGSTGKFTLTQIRDGFGPADWHPGDHPAMPEIVARGRKDGNIRACALSFSLLLYRFFVLRFRYEDARDMQIAATDAECQHCGLRSTVYRLTVNG